MAEAALADPLAWPSAVTEGSTSARACGGGAGDRPGAPRRLARPARRRPSPARRAVDRRRSLRCRGGPGRGRHRRRSAAPRRSVGPPGRRTRRPRRRGRGSAWSELGAALADWRSRSDPPGTSSLAWPPTTSRCSTSATSCGPGSTPTRPRPPRSTSSRTPSCGPAPPGARCAVHGADRPRRADLLVAATGTPCGGGPAVTVAERCRRAGCTGTIDDGYCDDCGLAPAARGPAARR